MAIIAPAIFGRSAFTFGRIRIIRFISSEERCPLNMIYKHALGKISYSLYLTHVFVIMFIFPSILAHTIALLRWPGDVWYFIYLCLVVSITEAIASVTYYLMELPFIRLGHQLASKLSSSKVRQPQPAPKSFLMPSKRVMFAMLHSHPIRISVKAQKRRWNGSLTLSLDSTSLGLRHCLEKGTVL